MRVRRYSISTAGVRNSIFSGARGMPAKSALLFAVVYAVALLLIPWEVLRREPFFDLNVYLESFELGTYDYLDDLDWPQYFLFEPLWRYVIRSLSVLLNSFPATFQVVSFLVSAVYAYTILRISRSCGVFLAAPLLIDLVLSQVRSALAGALFFIAVLAGNAFVWLLMLILAPLVHTSALLLFGFYALAVALSHFAESHPTAGKSLIVLFPFFIPLLYSISYVSILSSVGDRRSESDAAWPGGAFVLPFLIYFVSMLANLKFVMKHPIMILSVMVTGFFVLLAPFEINMLRLIPLAYPAVIASIFYLPYSFRVPLVTVMLVMTLYHFALWL